jgi:hypothetical protein
MESGVWRQWWYHVSIQAAGTVLAAAIIYLFGVLAGAYDGRNSLVAAAIGVVVGGVVGTGFSLWRRAHDRELANEVSEAVVTEVKKNVDAILAEHQAKVDELEATRASPPEP